MPDFDKTIDKLVSELEIARRRIIDLETCEIDRNRIKEHLALADNELEQIFESAGTAMRVVGTDFKTLRANEMFVQMAGVPKLDLINSYCYKTFPGPHCHTHMCRLKRILAGEKRIEVEIEKSTVAGKKFSCVVVSTPFHKVNGEIAGIVESFHDVTERKRSEEKIIQSELFLRSTLDGLSANIAILDNQGEILLVNKAWRDFAQLNGLKSGETLEGTNYLEVCEKTLGNESEEAKQFADGIRMVIAGELNLFSMEYPCHAQDIKRWFIGRVTPFSGDDRRRVIVAHENITDRKIIEDNLRESEERYRSFFSSNDAIKLIIDPTTGAIKDANPAAVEFYGYDLEQLKSMFLYDINTLTKEELLSVLSKTSEMGKGHYFFRHRLASGEIRDVEIYTSPILHDTQNLHISTIHDITELRRLELIKEDVERIIRHDLKNPLNGLINLPQVLKLDKNLTKEQIEIVDLIYSSGIRMLRMIDSSLDLYKMETGSYKYTPRKVDLLAIMKEIDINNQKILLGKNVAMRISIDGPAVSTGKLFVLSDENLLFTLLSNLIKNAIEASPRNEEVLIHLINFNDLQLVIKNKGSVPFEMRSNFFEKYKTMGKKHGTGLGTYSAKLIADRLGYEIAMETSDEMNETLLKILMPNV